MMQFIQFLQKRPSDKAIRTFRIIFGLLIIITWYYNLIYQWDSLESTLFGQDISNNISLAIKYAIIALWVGPILMWVTNICILKKKYMRMLQAFFAFLLFYASSVITDSADLEIDTLIWFLWIFPLIAWITWKCIPSYCMRYWEKIQKIRV